MENTANSVLIEQKIARKSSRKRKEPECSGVAAILLIHDPQRLQSYTRPSSDVDDISRG